MRSGKVNLRVFYREDLWEKDMLWVVRSVVFLRVFLVLIVFSESGVKVWWVWIILKFMRNLFSFLFDFSL